MQNKVLRLIDANYNRCLEGIRVCEDVTRFILEDKKLTQKFKTLRHKIARTKEISNGDLDKIVRYRNIERDVGKQSNIFETQRKDSKDILFVNLQRTKESLRVLEEFAKLKNRFSSNEFKKIRYLVYALEKTTLKKL